jgi:hypothetical protein
MRSVISRRHILVGAPCLVIGSLSSVGVHLGAQEQTRFPTGRISAIPTFHSIGLYWRSSSGAPDREASVSYRESGSAVWRKGHNLWFDERTHEKIPERGREYRGSIVGLQPRTEYEIELHIEASGEWVRTLAKTWNEEFPIGKAVRLPPTSAETLKVTGSGSPAGYVLYAPSEGDRALNDVAGNADYNVIIDASYVIVRGLGLRNAGRHAIVLRRGAHHVIIEDNDISGWGRVAEDGFGVDGDSGISNDETLDGQRRRSWPEIKAIVIQNNKIHHPRSNSNHWKQFRQIYGSTHPAGPQAITLWETGGNHVIRNNEIYSDERHYFNDGIGGGENFGYGGAPGPDSDIYGNKISHCWDDAIESEGGNANLRIWGNFLDKTYVMIAASPTALGPLYIFRNVSYRGRYSPQHDFNTGVFLKAQSRKVGNQFWGGGRVYVYHNTLFRTSSGEGTYVGITGFGTKLLGYVSRNNIYDNTKVAIEGFDDDSTNDFDYDLYTTVQDGGEHQRHGVTARPRYAASPGEYGLVEGAPGQDDGIVIPNFSDAFIGKAPDLGAQELGGPILRFGLAHNWETPNREEPVPGR